MSTSNDPTAFARDSRGVAGLTNATAGAASGSEIPGAEGLLSALATELYRAMDFGAAGAMPGQPSPAALGAGASSTVAPLPENPGAQGVTPDWIPPQGFTGHPISERHVLGATSRAIPYPTTAAPPAAAPREPATTGHPPAWASNESGYYFMSELPQSYGAHASPPALADTLACPTNLLDAGLAASFPEYRRTPAASAPAPHSLPLPAAPGVQGPSPVHASPIVRTDGAADAANPAFDVYSIRQDFPILQQRVNGKPLVWMDNGATTQKPRAVIDAISRFYERDNSNIHRGAHTLAARATDAYEHAREVLRRFLGAASAREIVFVRGTTEAINLVAQSFGRANIQAGDEIVLTTLEHHANIVPWQMLADEKGARLRVVPITDSGEVMLEEYARLLNPRTKIVALAHVSNTLGTVLPIELMTQMARAVGAAVLIDGAQAVAHLSVNVKAIDCDFYVLSGHKIFGPTGVGVLYGKLARLEAMPPWQGGGNMIDTVTFEKTTYSPVPAKFEAGTGILAGAVGLGAAIEYLERIGFEQAAAHESTLVQYGMAGLAAIPGVRLFGTAPHKASTLSFAIEGVDNADIGKALDREGIAIRVGHHCAQPTMARFGVSSMARPSLALYNTREEIDLLLQVIRQLAARRDRRG
jgi:cysteine desulfurase/selenocysteine lyase